MHKRLVFVTALVLAVFSNLAFANKFINFAKSKAHEQGITECDHAIESEFEHAGGDDMYVSSELFEDGTKFSRMTATFGSKGDAVKLVVTMLIENNQCKVFRDVQITTSNSCAKELAEDDYEYSGESPDYIWSENEYGADQLLTPGPGGGCIMNIQGSRIY